MLMLAVYRKLIVFHQNVTVGRWHSGIPRAVDIYEIDGKTVGLIGFGNIGEQVARRLRGFNARVIYYDSVRRDSREETALGVEYAPLDLLLGTADIVSLHTALNDSTRGMIGREALARMKPKAILINTCRGEVVDEDALIEALKDGRLLGAGLDTLRKEPTDPANPILKLSNVVLTPHSAGPTVDSFRKRFQNGYANIQRVAKGERPLWVIPEMRDFFYIGLPSYSGVWHHLVAHNSRCYPRPCSPLMIERVPLEVSVNPAEMVAFQVGEVQVLQTRPPKSAIRRKIELLPSRIVDECCPLAVGIHLDDLMGGRHFTASDERGQRHKERPVRGEGHSVR